MMIRVQGSESTLYDQLVHQERPRVQAATTGPWHWHPRPAARSRAQPPPPIPPPARLPALHPATASINTTMDTSGSTRPSWVNNTSHHAHVPLQSQQLPPGGGGAPIVMESLKLRVEEEREYYSVVAALPGVWKQDVHLALDDARVLSITAQRYPPSTTTSSSNNNNNNSSNHPHEPIAHINRKYILPKFANPKDMRADLIDGVLYIQVFKMGEWLASVKRRRMG